MIGIIAGNLNKLSIEVYPEIQNDNHLNNSVIVSFSFDDGTKSHLTAFKEMQKYNYKATEGVVAGYLKLKPIDYLSFKYIKIISNKMMEFLKLKPGKYLSLKDLKMLEQNGWEIASHTMTHVNLTKQTEARIKYELEKSKNLFKQNGIKVTTLIYPYSAVDERVINIAKKYYSFCRGGCSKPLNFNEIKNYWVNSSPDTSRYKIISIRIREKGYSPEWITSLLTNANNFNQPVWIDFHFHEIVEIVNNQYSELSINNFKNIIEIMHSHNINVYTLRDAYGMTNNGRMKNGRN